MIKKISPTIGQFFLLVAGSMLIVGCGLLLPESSVRPVISRIVPARGKPGDLVKIYGKRFSNPVRDSLAVLYFGGIPVKISENADNSDIRFWSAVEIRFTVPVTARAGLNNVWVETKDGKSNEVQFDVPGVKTGVPQDIVGWVLHDESPEALVFKAKAQLDRDGNWTLNTKGYTEATDGKFTQLVSFKRDGYEVRLRDVRVDTDRKTSWVSLSAYEISGPDAEHLVQPFINDYLTRVTGTEVGIAPDVLVNDPGWSLLWALGTRDQTLTGIDSKTEGRGTPLWRIYLQDLDPFLEVSNMMRVDSGLLMVGHNSDTDEGILALIAGKDGALTPDLFEVRFPGYQFSGTAALGPDGSELFLAAVTGNAGNGSHEEILRLDLRPFAKALSAAITSVTTAPPIDLGVSLSTALRATLALRPGERVQTLRAVPDRSDGVFDLWLGIGDNSNGNDYIASVKSDAFAEGTTRLTALMVPQSVPVSGSSLFVGLDAQQSISAVVSWDKGITVGTDSIAFKITLTDTASGRLLTDFGTVSVTLTASDGTFPASTSMSITGTVGPPPVAANFTWTSPAQVTDGIFTIVFSSAMLTPPVQDAFTVPGVPWKDTVVARRFDSKDNGRPMVRDPRDIYWVKDTPFVLITSHGTNEVVVFRSWGQPAYDHSFPSYGTGPTALYCGQKIAALGGQ